MATTSVTTLQSSTINGITGSTLTIGTNLTTETLQLGNTGTTITLRGPITAQTLGVTGTTTATGGITSAIPTTFTYTTLPTFTSSQIGYRISSAITANTNVAGTGATGNPFSATTFTLTPGVWLLNVQLRIRPSSGTVGITGMSLNHTLATPQTGYTNSYCNFKNQYSITIQDYSMNNSCIIVNNTASNVLTPAYVFNYTTTSSLVYRTDTFLIVTRIT
jgi:hypothetical protein